MIGDSINEIQTRRMLTIKQGNSPTARPVIPWPTPIINHDRLKLKNPINIRINAKRDHLFVNLPLAPANMNLPKKINNKAG